MKSMGWRIAASSLAIAVIGPSCTSFGPDDETSLGPPQAAEYCPDCGDPGGGGGGGAPPGGAGAYRVHLQFISRARRLVQGMDGGHHDTYCRLKDVLWSDCAGHITTANFFGNVALGPGIDGLGLEPQGVDNVGGGSAFNPASGSLHLSSSSLGPIMGPYAIDETADFWSPDGKKHEWENGVSEWTYLPVTIFDGNFATNRQTGNSGSYRLNWLEDDKILNPDDHYRTSTVPFGIYVDQCLATQKYFTTTIATNQYLLGDVLGGTGRSVCDDRGCSYGEYEVFYEVACDWH